MDSQESLLRSLGLREALALVVGTVIGTGVFLKAAVMSQYAGSPWVVLAAWVAAGAMSLAGALCYSELGALIPTAGGEYNYLREGYGELMGFLFGWMRFWIGTSGSIAAYGVGSATFLTGVMQIPTGAARTFIAIGLIVTFSLLNCGTVKFGGKVQSWLTVIKISIIIGLAGLILIFGHGNWSHLQSSHSWGGASAFGAAMLAALWAYEGWNNMPMAAGEIRDPGKNIPQALILGMLVVMILYLGVNLAYFYALPFWSVTEAYSNAHPSALPVATLAAQSALGNIAGIVLSLAFVLSALGAMNGSILTGARVPFAMARDGLFFSRLGQVSNRTHVPVAAILAQMVIASILAASGTFDQLTDYVIFASWIFYAMVAGSLFLLRRRWPQHASPFRVPFYPVLPALFIICAALLLVNTLVTAPKQSGIGLIFIILGIPVYFLFKRRRPQSRSNSP